jgi:hypothetical protein
MILWLINFEKCGNCLFSVTENQAIEMEHRIATTD